MRNALFVVVWLFGLTASVNALSFRFRVLDTKSPTTVGRHGAVFKPHGQQLAPTGNLVKTAAARTSEWVLQDRPHWTKTLARPLLAEFIGTFIVVQFGLGAVMSATFAGALVGILQVSAVWAIAITLASYITTNISGAHLNPAVTLAFAFFRDFSWRKVLPYMMAQLAGATCAAGMSLFFYASTIRDFEATHKIIRGTAESVKSAKAFGVYFSDPITSPTAFLAEAFGTAMVTFIVFCLTNPRNETMKGKDFSVPPLTGLCVAGLVCAIAPINQAGFNPARDFGPRIVSWLAGWRGIAFTSWWVYFLGPLVGAPIGAFLADKVLFAVDDNDDESDVSNL